MSVAGTADVPIEVLGGLVTNLAAADLPHGVSPDCQDVQFQIGSVKTRPGLTSLYQLIGNPTINFMKTYENLQEVPRFLSLDSLGVLRVDATPGGALNVISSGILPGSFCSACSLFGREYFAFGNPYEGFDIPRQYDDTNFDRVSQYGPALAPSVVDETVAYALIASPVGAIMLAPYTIIQASENGDICTLTIRIGAAAGPTAFNVQQGDTIVVSGCTVAGYNGTFTIADTKSLVATFNSLSTITYYNATTGLAVDNSGTGSLQFSYADLTSSVAAQGIVPSGASVIVAGVTNAAYNGTWRVVQGITAGVFDIVVAFAQTGVGSSGGGTVAIVGNVDAGLHQVSVIFVTRNGYYTRPAPPSSWTAAGSKRAVVTSVPIGPPNVIARVLCFTGVAGASFYHLGPTGITLFSSNMVISDNTTTQTTVDFSDELLLLGTLDDPLFNQNVLSPAAGSIDYSERLFWWGTQANIQNVLNLSFDGGFSNLTSATTGTLPNFPLGWQLDATYSPGGASANVQGEPAVFGDAYAIYGNGATPTRGKITQSVYLDYLLNTVFLTNTAYTVRARIMVLNATAGTVHVNLQSTIGGFTTVGISQAWNTLTGTYLAYEGNLTSGLTSIPTDLQLQIYADGTPNNGAIFLVDEIEIFPTDQQFNNSTLIASFGQEQFQGQESYDSQTGQIQYNLNNGQSIRACFKIRERLYIVKEHCFGVTQDDGVNEPSGWTIDDVSKRVGTPSTRGVAVGEDWVVIAHRTGLYLFWGGEVLSITEEIRPTWESINWEYGYLLSVAVDTRRRRIFVSAPFGSSTVPNETLVLDYHDVGSDATAIASNPPIHLTYTGRKTAFDRARKWCPWTIPANSIAQIEQEDLQSQVYFGSNDGTGNVNLLDDTDAIFTDNGATIPSYYTTAFWVEQPLEQSLKLGTHRKLFLYLTTYCQGNGLIGVTIFRDTLSDAIVLNPQALSNPAVQDIEMMLNQTIERMAIKISSQGNGEWFDLQKMTANVSPDPWAPVRGVN